MKNLRPFRYWRWHINGRHRWRYAVVSAMRSISFKRHRFPPDIIRQAIWLYARFTLSFRDVEEMLAERGLDISYETVRR
jgi:transposase-like protein